MNKSLVSRSAEERQAPVLMTALAPGLAMLPTVVGGNKSGHKVEHPLAVVISGWLAHRRFSIYF